MKTFTTALLVIALSSMALAVDNCTPGKCGNCAYNTDDSKNYCKYCIDSGFSAEWNNSSCSGSIAIDNCNIVMFSGETDTVLCAGCDEGYDTNDAGTACEAIVTPDNCTIASSSTDCFVCNSGYYLELDGDCQEVTDPVDNCSTYSTATLCLTCMDGYYLDDNECKDGDIANCAYYVSELICGSCDAGYYVSGVDSDACTQGEISNCDTYNILDTDECSTCAENYHTNADSSKCLTTEGCSNPEFSSGDSYDCRQCDIDNSYYAVDVDGTTMIDSSFWAQVCEMNAAIQTIFILCLSVVALF